CTRWGYAVRPLRTYSKRRSTCVVQSPTHAPQRLREARARRPEVQADEARRTELRPGRERDTVPQEDLVGLFGRKRGAIDPRQVSRLHMRHRQRHLALDEVAVGTQVIDLRREPGAAFAQRRERRRIAKNRW